MAISLTLFLNINFLILALFPYISMFPCKKSEEAKSYAISFCSNAAFLICYSILCLPILQKDLFSFSYRCKKDFCNTVRMYFIFRIRIFNFLYKIQRDKICKIFRRKKIIYFVLFIANSNIRRNYLFKLSLWNL